MQFNRAGLFVACRSGWGRLQEYGYMESGFRSRMQKYKKKDAGQGERREVNGFPSESLYRAYNFYFDLYAIHFFRNEGSKLFVGFGKLHDYVFFAFVFFYAGPHKFMPPLKVLKKSPFNLLNCIHGLGAG